MSKKLSVSLRPHLKSAVNHFICVYDNSYNKMDILFNTWSVSLRPHCIFLIFCSVYICIPTIVIYSIPQKYIGIISYLWNINLEYDIYWINYLIILPNSVLYNNTVIGTFSINAYYNNTSKPLNSVKLILGFSSSTNYYFNRICHKQFDLWNTKNIPLKVYYIKFHNLLRQTMPSPIKPFIQSFNQTVRLSVWQFAKQWMK